MFNRVHVVLSGYFTMVVYDDVCLLLAGFLGMPLICLGGDRKDIVLKVTPNILHLNQIKNSVRIYDLAGLLTKYLCRIPGGTYT
jgi:hypothetical protein